MECGRQIKDSRRHSNHETGSTRGTSSRRKWLTKCYLASVQQALGQELSSKGLVMNQDRDEAKMAATQNSPPLDLLGEI
ncbi:hypothetical protein EYF80_008961 [Liparis tanakae]|uniref:Uncharacterized protein n=1 Tax=Liparis tanakae TaxID=230148 RepID=A0A4Z2ISI1_9TELE|nr:hypothetical protein EYF80_008961 [Liparis tanakae]